jgi:hypothetical protein
MPAAVYAGLALLAAGFQTALAAGAPLGRWTLGGLHPGRLPAAQRAAATVQSTLYLAMAAVVAGQGGWLGWSPPGWALWLTLGVTALAALGALVSPSRAERRLWGPVMAAMLAAALWTAAAP